MESAIRHTRWIIVLFLVFPLFTSASDRPPWVEKAFWEDIEYYYYVGVSSDAKTEEEGRQQAHERALAEAIQHLFGIKTAMSRRAFISDDNIIVDEDLSAELPKSFLVGVKVVNQFIEREKNRFRVWRAISVPKNISNLNEYSDSIFINNYDTTIGHNSIGKGILIVKTDPINSKIILNGNYIGNSPAEFKNVGTGKYKLKIEKSGFTPITREVLIAEGAPTNLSLKLKPDLFEVSIKTTPEKAKVFIGKAYIGETPVVTFLKPNNYRFRVEKENFGTDIFNYKVSNLSSNEIDKELTPLPGMLSMQSMPQGAKVYDEHGGLLGTTPIYFEKFATGEHHFIYEYPGYPLKSEYLKVNPAELTESIFSFNNTEAPKLINKKKINNTTFWGRGELPLIESPKSMNIKSADKLLIKISKQLAIDNLVEEIAKSKFRENKIQGSRKAFWDYIKNNASVHNASYTYMRNSFYITTITKIDLANIIK